MDKFYIMFIFFYKLKKKFFFIITTKEKIHLSVNKHLIILNLCSKK